MKKISVLVILFVLQTPLLAQNNVPDFRMKTVETDQGIGILAISQCYAPIDLYVANRHDSLKQSIVIEPFDSTLVWNLGEGNPTELVEEFNSMYTVGYYLGDTSKIRPRTDYLYSLPFRRGRKYSVSQGFRGKFSHQGVSEYAIDFLMKIGEPVHAAREGIVVKVEDQFTESGGKEFLYMANRIQIQHDDGTIASYVHLDKNGALVTEGEFVEKGQHIGFSGNTGYTRGPHLHFVVRKGKDVSIPIYFEGYAEEILKEHKKYKRK